jgi:polyhydroxyalkanoate synthase subunit PhaC
MASGLLSRQLKRLGARYEALLAEQTRALDRAMRSPSIVQSALTTRVGTTPHDVVFRAGTLSLLRYRRDTPAAHAPPVLLCYALINRPYILDLQPDKSVVRRYLEQGFDVYLIDWGVPSHADRSLTLEDYVCRLLDSVIELILRQHRCENLHLLGYCMGGTLAALYTALNPERVKTLTLLAAPIEFSGRETLLNVWANRKYFDVDAFVEANGNCPAWFLQLCFLYTKPIQNLVEKNLAFYEQMSDARFVSNFLAMEHWVNDNIPVAGETFREFVKKLYQENQLVRGELCLGARKVDLGRIACPLLLLTAKNDHLVSPASTNRINAYVASAEVKVMMIEAGHVGLVVSSKAHKTLWPEATRWLAEREPPLHPVRSPAAAE